MVPMGLSPTIHAASFGIQDSIFLMLLALVVFGPRRLPEIGRQIGKLMYEFRKVSNDFKFQMEEELRASEEADRQRKLQATLAATTPAIAASDPAPSSDPAPRIADSSNIEGEASAEALPGEVRAEPRRFPPTVPTIQPPSTGNPIASQRPFRGRLTEEASESAPEEAPAAPPSEPAGSEQEAHHG